MLYNFLIGQKFGPFMQVFHVLLITWFVPFKLEYLNRNFKRFIRIIIFAGVIFILFSWWQMSLERGGAQNGLEQLFNRISNGQGDVWWGIYSSFSKEPIHIKELSDELGAFSSSGLQQINYNFGIYKMMRLIAPSNVLQYYANRGARFSSSTTASLFYYFGFPGTIVIKLGLYYLMYYLTNKIVDMCKNQRWIEATMYMWLFTHFTRVNNMSEFDLVVSRSAIMCYLVLLFMHFYRKSMTKQSVSMIA